MAEEKTTEEKAVESEKNHKEESKKTLKKEVATPKDKAVVYCWNSRVSTKNCVAICRMILGETPEKAIEILEKVIKGKKVVRMHSAEIPHRKSRGQKHVAGGRFPKKASIEIIALLKQLNANANVNQIENPVIGIAMANQGSRPFRRGGTRAKRTHIYLEAKGGEKK